MSDMNAPSGDTDQGPDFDSIPTALRAYPQWVLWGGGPSRDGKIDKTPRDPRQNAVSITDPTSWLTFEQARDAYTRTPERFGGVGFVLTRQDPFVAIDLDHVAKDFALQEWAEELCVRVLSYTEWSPSGDGVHIWTTVDGLDLVDGNKKNGVEIYSHDRYVTVTGHAKWQDVPVNERTEAVESVYRQYFPEAPSNVIPMFKPDLPTRPDHLVLALAEKDPAWVKTWKGDDSDHGGDASAGDLVFCKILCRVSGDDDQVDRLYRKSGRARAKWDRSAGATTYGVRTIAKARSEVLLEVNDQQRGPVGVDGYGYHDEGNAQRLLAANPGRLRWVAEWDSWMIYDEGRWVRDPKRAQAQRLAAGIADPLLDMIGPIRQDKVAIKEFMSWYRYTKSASGVANAVTMARGMPAAWTSHRQLDRRPWLFNALNKTLDLEDTGYSRDPDPSDLLTKKGGVAYEAGAKSPRWDRFLAQVLPDPEVRAYVQGLAGLALIGVAQEILPILWGDGANGKTTLTEVMAGVLGEYAVTASQDLLIVQKQQAHPTSKADLFGARFAHSGEIEQSDRLNESLVKSLTGNDTIKARRMGEDFWEFQPSHLLWLHANYKPQISGQDTGIWRRLKLIPFEVIIPKDQREEGLSRKILDEEGPGVLNWMLRGLAEWRRNGRRLPEPPAVLEATEDYRSDANTVQTFVDDSGLRFGDRLWVKASELDMKHMVWYGTSSVRVKVETHSKMVKAELRKRGCETRLQRVDGRPTQVWSGCGFAEPTTLELP